MPCVRASFAAAVLAVAFGLALASCDSGGKKKHDSGGGGGGGAFQADCETGTVLSTVPGDADWPTVKAAQAPVNALPGAYAAPYPQPLANLAWEDGIYISRDGLALYAIYMPMDALQAVIDGGNPETFEQYKRGNLIGQDFSVPYLGPFTEWIHADIVCSQRASTSDPFPPWKLTDLKFQTYNRGAPQGVQNAANPDRFDYFVFTEDTGGLTHIRALVDTGRNPGGTIYDLPGNVTDGTYRQDNPHLEVYQAGSPPSLVLFFDSPDTPGEGGLDIWYTASGDGGTTWSNPANVSSVNTTLDDHQPHLYFDGTNWWLYWTTVNSADSKFGIFRAQQGTPGDWDSWGTPELVVSSGTSAGVGEPSLTANGDLSFVVVTKNPSPSNLKDQNDADPWFMPKL